MPHSSHPTASDLSVGVSNAFQLFFSTMRILHAFKIYRPEIEGGVPEVIGLLTSSTEPNVQSRILVARRFGLGHERDVNHVPVKAVTSLGDLFSMPIAPTFP